MQAVGAAPPALLRPRLARRRGARGRLVVIGLKGLDRAAITARHRRLSSMHLLAAKPGAIADGSEAVDLGQSAGRHRRPVRGRHRTRLPRRGAGRAGRAGAPSLRLANLLQLGHNLSVDLYVDEHRRARPAGGRAAARRRALLALRRRAGERLLPPARHRAGRAARRRPARSRTRRALDARPPTRAPALALPACRAASTTPAISCAMPRTPDRPRRGLARARAAAARRPLLARRAAADARRPAPAMAGRARRSRRSSSTARWCRPATSPPIDALIAALRTPASIRCRSSSPASRTRWRRRCSRELCAETAPAVILNATGFALSQPGGRAQRDAVRRRRLPGAAGGVRRRQRGGLARRHARPRAARPRHARGAAGGRRPHPHPRRLLQGRGRAAIR